MKKPQILEYLTQRSDEIGECLVWTGATNSAGHPVASIGGRRAIPVRRWAWEAWHGIEAGELRVVTQCGTLRCVHPACSLAMTVTGVNRRIAARGGMSTPAARMARTRNGRKQSPLTMDDARAIRALRDEGKTLAAIAQAYPVSVDTIGRICRGMRWVDHQNNPNPFAQLLKIAA